MRTSLAPLLASLLLPCACGGSTSQASADGGTSHDAALADSQPGADTGAATEAGSDAADFCHLDPPGTSFTFHVHNGGTRMLALAYGCGGSLPIVLPTAQGSLGIGPGPANVCEFTCDVVYTGMAASSCSDCGPGVGAALGPGATVDIKWDRRVYEGIMADPSCTKGAGPQSCALGLTVASATTQQGTITVCTSTSPGPGSCATSEMLGFTVDTTQSAGTIAVQ